MYDGMMESPRTSVGKTDSFGFFNRTMSEPACGEMRRSALSAPPPAHPFTCLKGKLYPGPLASVPQSRSLSSRGLALACSWPQACSNRSGRAHHLDPTSSSVPPPGLTRCSAILLLLLRCCLAARAAEPSARACLLLLPRRRRRQGGEGTRARRVWAGRRFSSVDRSVDLGGGNSRAAAGAARDS